MLAVVILGLGVLGLAAMFAGAARQQQTATQVRRSVQTALNAKTALTGTLGSVEGVAPGDLPDGQWAWVRALSVDDPSLTISNIGNSGMPDAFFRVRAPGEVLFENPASGLTGAGPADAIGQGMYTVTSPTPPFGSGAVSNISDLANTGVIPSSFFVRVTISDSNGLAGAPLTRTYHDPTQRQDKQIVDSIVLRRNDNQSAPDRVVMRLNPSNGGAFIESFKIMGLTNTQWISKIEALKYQWRSTKLLSLNERLSYVQDDRFPPAGLRPELGFALFFRRSGEINQAAVLTYALTPRARPRLRNDQFPFVPPEHLPPTNPDALVREIPVDIGWDTGRGQYYVSVDKNSSTAWVAEPGQILLMSSTQGFGNALNDPGADDVVRVVAQSLDPNNPDILRGWLDDGPRVNLSAVTPQRAGVTPTRVYVYALQPEVENADPQDDTRWKITPVDARLIPIAAN